MKQNTQSTKWLGFFLLNAYVYFNYSSLRNRANTALEKYEPIDIAFLTAATLITAASIAHFSKPIYNATQRLTNKVNDKGITFTAKQSSMNFLFFILSTLPFQFVKTLLTKIIEKEKSKMFGKLRDENNEKESQHEHLLYKSLPSTPLDPIEMEKLFSLANQSFNNGKTSGALYNAWSKQDLDMFGKIETHFAFTNPLHPESWPLVQMLHNRVTQMIANLFHDPNAYGIITSGGTGSIMEVCHAYTTWARTEKNITKPRVIAPESIHVAFETAANDYDFELVKIKINPQTKCVDLAAMEACIDHNTVLLVGSAPNYPYGTLDDIPAIANLAKKHNIFCHVDSCLGGFITAFSEKFSCDFRNAGVTSIAADTHKYGWAPKGSSITMMRRNCPASVFLTRGYFDSSCGLYVKPSVEGSRQGSTIAKIYYALCRMSFQRYREQAEKITALTEALAAACHEAAPELSVCGNPSICVVALENKTLKNKDSIYVIAEQMKKANWELSIVKDAFHICITADHYTHEQFITDFIKDLKIAIAHVIANPNEKPHGTAKAYGQLDTGTVPDAILPHIAHGYQEVTNSSRHCLIPWLKETAKKTTNENPACDYESARL